MDKHNKNEETIKLRPYVDYRDPEQLDPWKCQLVKDELLRKTANMQADIDKQLEDLK